jgi:hypothetical protein
MTNKRYLQKNTYLCQKFKVMEEKNQPKKERTVVHLYLKSDDSHHYFGSMANVYEHFESAEIGISFGALRNYGLSANKPYENKRVIIRKGVLLAKPKKNP